MGKPIRSGWGVPCTQTLDQTSAQSNRCSRSVRSNRSSRSRNRCRVRSRMICAAFLGSSVADKAKGINRIQFQDVLFFFSLEVGFMSTEQCQAPSKMDMPEEASYSDHYRILNAAGDEHGNQTSDSQCKFLLSDHSYSRTIVSALNSARQAVVLYPVLNHSLVAVSQRHIDN